MPPKKPTIQRRSHRLEALADGVFSIVYTFLVLTIVVPENTPETRLDEALTALWPNFLSFGICAALVGIYWTAHHAIFGFIERISHELIWLHLLFLALVSLVPFSANVLARFPGDAVALQMLALNMLAVGLSLVGIWRHATHGRRLVSPTVAPEVVRYGYTRILVGVVGYGLALVSATRWPVVALTILGLVPLSYILPPLQRRWLRRYNLAVPGDPDADDGWPEAPEG